METTWNPCPTSWEFSELYCLSSRRAQDFSKAACTDAVSVFLCYLLCPLLEARGYTNGISMTSNIVTVISTAPLRFIQHRRRFCDCRKSYEFVSVVNNIEDDDHYR